MLDIGVVTMAAGSSPLLVKSKQVDVELPLIEEVVFESDVHVPKLDAAEDSGTEEASAKQGTAERKQKTTARKRKATLKDEATRPAAKKQKAAITVEAVEPDPATEGHDATPSGKAVRPAAKEQKATSTAEAAESATACQKAKSTAEFIAPIPQRKETAYIDEPAEAATKERKATLVEEIPEPATKRDKVAPTSENAEPATKKKEATPKKKASSKKIGTGSKRRPRRNEEALEIDPPLPPLPLAIERKVAAVNTFLETHSKRLLQRETGSHVSSVDELDLLAALNILQVDYHLAHTVLDVPFADADEIIIDGPRNGKVGVDFSKRCGVERAVQEKLTGRLTGLDEVSLLEVEIDMLVAKKKQMVEDEIPAAGFRVYDDDVADDGATSHGSEGQDEGEENMIGDAIEEAFAEESVTGSVVGKGIVEEDGTKQDVIKRDATPGDATGANTIEQEIFDKLAGAKEAEQESEQEAVDEQDSDEESEEE